MSRREIWQQLPIFVFLAWSCSDCFLYFCVIMHLNNLFWLFLISLFASVAGNWIAGTGERVLLPSSDFPISVDANPANGYLANTPDYLANISTTHPMFKNKFLLFGDSLLFEVVGACDNSSASCVTFPSNRNASDQCVESTDQIDDLAFKFATFGIQDTVVVLSFGFDDIRFNLNEKPTEVAVHVMYALIRMERRLRSQNIRIQIWFLTIPEIGDLAPKFKKFNDFFRRFSEKGITVLDFSEMALFNKDAPVADRFTTLVSFFEQKLDKQLLTIDPRLDCFYLKKRYRVAVKPPSQRVYLVDLLQSDFFAPQLGFVLQISICYPFAISLYVAFLVFFFY